MADPERLLDDIASSIADGAVVDWEQPVDRLSARERRVFGHLRLIDSLATVYRTLPPEPDSDPADDPLARPDPPGPRWGRLVLLDRIGQGASGDVFRAWDVDLQREVALKLLHVDGGSDASANARLLGEARRLARVGHPHVIHVYGAERHEERIGLWMELVRGRTLDEIVRADGPLPATDAAAMGADLCGAIAAVHAAGLLHRDIKAQNVIRDDNGRVVLMDFGTGDEIASARPVLAGTPLYLAPEILAGGPATPASDVYSLGVLLFHLASGRYPVSADSVERLREAHRAGRRLRLKDAAGGIPQGFARVVERALAADPSHRYASATDMEQALREFLRRPATVSTTATWRTWWFAAVTALVIAALVATTGRPWSRVTPAPGVTSIAVLPLTYVSGQADAPYLAEGLTDQLITTLGQVGAFRVTADTSVARFKGATEPVASIAKQLGVEAILEGTVTIDPGGPGRPGRVRVNARVIRAGTGLDIWAGSLERPLGDLLALEDDLARVIAQQVHAHLSSSEVARLQGGRSTNPAAEQAYLEGRAHLSQFAAQANLALTAFHRATELDPLYAAAHAGAGRSYIALGFARAISQPEARASALAEVTRALELDPELPEGHGVMADLRFFYDWDFAAAEREYLRAIETDPSAAFERAQYAQFLAAMGRLDEARQQIDQSIALDPLSAQPELTRALVLYYSRRFDEAIASVRRAEALDPSLPTAHFLMGRILEASGDLAAAVHETQKAIDGSAVVAAGWRVQKLRLQALQGDIAGARAGFSALARSEAAVDLESSPYEAYLRLATAEPDTAVTLLMRAVARRDPSVLWIDVDPRLDQIRGRPEFAELRRRIGLH